MMMLVMSQNRKLLFPLPSLKFPYDIALNPWYWWSSVHA